VKSNVLYIFIPAVLVVRALLVSVPVAIAFRRFDSTGLCRLRFNLLVCAVLRPVLSYYLLRLYLAILALHRCPQPVLL